LKRLTLQLVAAYDSRKSFVNLLAPPPSSEDLERKLKWESAMA
jgi:hypothetical protein